MVIIKLIATSLSDIQLRLVHPVQQNQKLKLSNSETGSNLGVQPTL